MQACGNASSPEYNGGGNSNESSEQKISVAYLKSLCRGTLFPVTEELWIEGYVVANDLFGEFTKLLIVTDASGGIEVAIESGTLYKEFETGCTVRIDCNGLALGDYGGKIQLGAPPTGEYIIDRIAQESLGRYIRRSDASPVDIRPTTLCFGDKSSRYISSYVRFEQVRFAQEEIGLPFCEWDAEEERLRATDRHLVDERNDTLLVRIAATCTYANEPIPDGTGSLCGVLDYFNGDYMLRVTNQEIDLR